MPQARGSQAKFYLYDEDTYGQDPGTPAAKRVYLTGCNLATTQNKLEDDTLLNARTRARPDAGNIDGGGSIPMNMAAEDIGPLLKHALGQVATYRPVSTQPANITGVTVAHAESTCPTGNGTLSFTAVGTLLSWQASGDTAGAGVDVSAGGTFTLQSGTAGAALTVTVAQASLPGTDQSDTITVVAAYKHVFTIGDLPAGFTFEKDFGANIAGTGRVEKFNGCRIATGTFDFPQEGYCTANFDVKAANSTLQSAALDATPEDNGHTSFSAFRLATLEEGGAAIAKVKSHNYVLNNELDEDGYVQGGSNSGIRVDMSEGFATVTGQITAIFDDATLLTKAINSTASSLRSVLKRGDGFGTAGNESIEFLVSAMEYERASPEVSGPGGILQQLNFKAYGSGSLQVTLFNSVAAV